MKKVYDLSVKVSSYVDREGTTKNKYENVGAVMEKEDGGRFILLNRTFNPAGCPNPENKSSVIISMFEPRDDSKKSDGNKPDKSTDSKDHGPDSFEENPFSDDDVPF